MIEIFTAISWFIGLIIRGIEIVFYLVLSIIFVSYKGLILGVIFTVTLLVLFPLKIFDRIKNAWKKNPIPFVIIYIIFILFLIGGFTEDYTYKKIKAVFWELGE